MSSFSYTARNKTGVVSKGTVFANDRAAATSELQEKGLTPILITQTRGKSDGGITLPIIGKIKFGGKVKLKDKVIFSQQFATMINAGVPITKALAILKDQTESKTLAKVISDLTTSVEGGSSLANALSVHTDVFSPVYINMVKAGEAGGILDEVLNRLAEQQQKDAEIVGKVRSAMIYPGVVTTATFGAFFFLMTVIVPKLGAIFDNLGAKLPIYTLILLAISHAMVKFGVLIFAGIGGAIFLLLRFKKTPRGKHLIDSIILRLPIFGPIITKVNVARFARTFGSLMSSGIPVLEALNATSSAIGNSIFRDELDAIAQQVKNGKPISEEMRKSKHFPPIVSQMVSVGEETGELDKILIKLAEFYEKEVDTVVEGMTSIIEPILIMVIGVMVGFVLVSVFGPLAALNNAV